MSLRKFKVDFIGIGAGKSGTTWVAHMLDQHPDICVSEPKEVCYFNAEAISPAEFHGKGRREQSINRNHTRPLSWYELHFRHCKEGQIIGEYSPGYFYDPQAPRAIKEAFPGVKLIVALRNPIDRAYSDYWMHRNSFKTENRDFDEAVHEPDSPYLNDGFYYRNLEHYLKWFKKEQILVVFFEDIRKDPATVTKDLYRFLEVDESFVPGGMKSEFNYSKTSRFKGAVEMMNRTASLLVWMRMVFVVRLLKKLKINKLVLKIISKRTEYPPMDMKTRSYLRETFREDIGRLEAFLDKDLSLWK